MKLLGFCLLAVLAILARPTTCAKNGGISCLICTSLVTELEQLMEFNNSTVVEVVDKVCDFFPSKVYEACREAFHYLGPGLIELIAHNNGPDATCHALNLCYTEPGLPTCQMNVNPPLEPVEVPFRIRVEKAKAIVRPHLTQISKLSSICDIPGIKFICEWVKRTVSDRSPLEDFDKDGFSPTMAFRGSAWRGKDCSDIFPNIHPGALPVDRDIYQDSNCNGIFGINPKTSQPYEDELCSLSQPRGVAILGDSIGAHFSLPPSWLDATKLSKAVFNPLALVIEDEADWPMLGSFTGHGNNSWSNIVPGAVDSIYKRLFEQNRCNHRDYQNMAVNGGDSFNVHDYMKTLSRDRLSDRPLIVFIVLVGNDVCQGGSHTLDTMTTPEQMLNNTLVTLNFLNQRLPAGSSVIVLGLANGRALYDTMAKRIHPLGDLWQQFTYAEFYDYLNCLEISPCVAWMNTDQATRDRAAQRVMELNKVLSDVAQKNFSNFNLHYLDDPLDAVVKEWASQGGEPWQLVEPSDGFHSNQIAQGLTAKVLWDSLMANHPEVLGPVNPHNADIQALFGDQGGL